MSSIHVTNVKDASGNAALVTESGGVKTDKLTGISTAGSISVVGEGGSTTTNLQQGLAKAWLYAPATVGSISDSFNISSADDDGTGLAGMNLTSNMSSANYVTKATHQTANIANTSNVRGVAFHSKSASAMEARAYYINNHLYVLYEGSQYYNVSAHGDLA
jgi:hypothetical protein